MENKRKIPSSFILSVSLLSAMLFFLFGCREIPEVPKKIRIAVAGFAHETCTFCPNPTTVEDYENGGVLHGEDVLNKYRGALTYINGYIKAAEEAGNVELVGILDASNPSGGSSGSWLTRECFDKYSHGIAEGIKKSGPFDGVLLALHGAMAVKGILKPEAEIVRRVKTATGSIPIMVTLDLHANEDHELTDAADGVFIIKTYPHADTEEIGVIAARCLIKTIKGEFVPTMAVSKPGVISPSIFQGTDFTPAKEIMERAREWEKREKDAYCVSVAFGFAYADVPDVGATVIAVTNGNRKLARKIAEDVSNLIWNLKEPFAGKTLPKTKQGVEKAIQAAKLGKTPVVIADQSDRTGDATHILRELIAQGAKNFALATLADKKTLEKIVKEANAGQMIEADVGGYAHELSGTPVHLKGKVEYLGPCEYAYTSPIARGLRAKVGTVVVIGFGENNHVIITPSLHQVIDDAIFPAVGLNSEKLDIIVLKTRVHFRAFYDKKSGTIIEIDAPGLGPADLTTLDYKNVPQGIYPLGQKR